MVLVHTGITIMYPTVVPHPWQQRDWVRHSHVRGGNWLEEGLRVGGRRTSGLEVYAEQLTGKASDE